MKKIVTLITLSVLMLGIFFSTSIPAKATTIFPSKTSIVMLEDGNYLETTIIDEPKVPSGISLLSATKTITRTKITRFKNKNGSILWSVSITATFTYNGSTSKCTSCSHSTTCPSSTWKIKSVSSSRSGNSATAKAIATRSFNNISENYTKTVTIKCDKNGNVS